MFLIFFSSLPPHLPPHQKEKEKPPSKTFVVLTGVSKKIISTFTWIFLKLFADLEYCPLF